MIVLIDDERTFKKNVTSGDYVLLKTSSEAISWLESLPKDSKIDQLWLDHDLGMIDDEKITIIPFIRILEAMSINKTAPDITQVVVHTSNPVGGNEIVSSMRKYFPTVRVSAGDYLVADYSRDYRR